MSAELPAATRRYTHIQSAPLCLILYVIAIAEIVAAIALYPTQPAVTLALGSAGLAVLLLAGAFHHLAVVDRGDHLLISFGPIPLFRRRLRYSELESVQVGRTTLLDGLGIHYSLSGGWVWNIWGSDCVEVRYAGKLLKIGTDDPVGLARLLAGKIPAQ